MSQTASTAAWRSTTSAHTASKRIVRLIVAVLIGVVAAQYLAGYVFLLSCGMNPREATPFTLIRYGYFYGDRRDVRVRLVLGAASGFASVGFLSAIALMPRRRSLHGDARFANRREIAGAGLLGNDGIILGTLAGKCLMLPGQQGVAVAAPPRSGKGVGIVIPNALNWPGSLVCVDIKKENWHLTAGFRQHSGQQCFLFDPFSEDGRTARWNPFFYVSDDPLRRVNDVQRIAEMLYPDPPNVDPFWTASARSLFLGIALYLFETPSLPKTIGEVLRQGMASDDEGFGQHWKRVIEGRNSGRFPLSPQCVRALYDVIDLAPVTASSIRKTFTSRLDLWLNPILDAATCTNDFDLRELRKSPISVYVGVNPDDLSRLRPVLSLFFQQCIGLQTRELPERNAQLKYQLMLLLDEFTALGRIPIMAESISYLPGYNVRIVLVVQTPAQLRDVYGANAAETMLKALGARVAFAPKDHADAREISDELGFQTVKVRTRSEPVLDLLNRKSSRQRSVSVSEQRRALMLPQEVREIGDENAVVFYEGLRPIRCKKIRYYADKRFKGRLLAPPEVANLTSAMDPLSAQSGPLESDYDGISVAQDVAAPVYGHSHEGATAGARSATADDVTQLESLTLEDFDVDFGRVHIPEKSQGERLTADELNDAVENFLATLQGR